MSTARATGWGRRAYSLQTWDEVERLQRENHRLREALSMAVEELQVMEELLAEAHLELGAQHR